MNFADRSCDGPVVGVMILRSGEQTRILGLALCQIRAILLSYSTSHSLHREGSRNLKGQGDQDEVGVLDPAGCRAGRWACWKAAASKCRRGSRCHTPLRRATSCCAWPVWEPTTDGHGVQGCGARGTARTGA